MKNLGIKSAKVHVELDYYLTGSVLAGTVSSGVTEVRSDFEVESDEDEDDILNIIRLAKRGCFAERLVQTAVSMKSTLRLNGKDAGHAIVTE